jgi:hypothetical protein
MTFKQPLIEPDTAIGSAGRSMSRRSIDALILRSSGWPEFFEAVAALANETDKGDCFERLVQLYMQSAPHMVSHYKQYGCALKCPAT